jgi:uncharacterized membrane protein
MEYWRVVIARQLICERDSCIAPRDWRKYVWLAQIMKTSLQNSTRLAPGATRSEIVTLLIRQEVLWITVGIVLGTVGAVITDSLLSAILFHSAQVSLTALTSSLLLLTVPTFLSIVFLARRASLLYRAVALHQE